MHNGRFSASEEEKGSGGRGEASAGEPDMAMLLWGILYADDVEIVSQSSQQLRRMMGVIVVVLQTVRPTEHSPRALNPDAQSRGTRDNDVRLRHVEPARVPPRHAAPSPPQLPDSLHRLAKERSRRPPDFLSGHAYEDAM